MKHKAAKIGLTIVVLGAAFGGLMFSTMGAATEYYKLVDEVMAEPEQWYGKRLQLHGFAKNVMRKPSTLEYRFQVESKGQVVTATYKGVVPDTFRDDAEVVLKGTLSPEGFTVAPNGVMAKCPSKYEAQAIGGATGATPAAPR
jgi:cytochrome c-type biogenesis protein CcmE